MLSQIPLVSLSELFNMFTRYFSVVDEELLETRKNRQEFHKLLEKVAEYTGKNSDIVKSLETGIIKTKDLKELRKKMTDKALDNKRVISKNPNATLSVKEKKLIKEEVTQLKKALSENTKESQKIDFKESLKERSFYQKVINRVNKEQTHHLFKGALGLKGALGILGTMKLGILQNITPIDQLSNKYGLDAKKQLNRFQSTGDVLKTHENPFGNSAIGMFGIQTQLEQEMGNIFTYSKNTLSNLERWEYSMGIANDEAVQLLNTMIDINHNQMSTAEESKNFVQRLASFAKQNGVGYKRIFDDVKNNASLYAKYSGVGLNNVIKANLASQKLGLNFSEIGKVLESFQDVEGTIQKQMKLSIYLGRNVDFITAATHQFHGQTDLAMKSLLGQLELISEEQFNQPYIRGEFAKQLGVSEDKLVRLFRAAKQGSDVFSSIKMDKQFTEDLDAMNDMINSNGLDKLKMGFAKYILKPFADLFASETSAGTVLINGIVGIMSIAGKILQRIDKFTNGIGSLFLSIGTFLTVSYTAFFRNNVLLSSILAEVRAIRMDNQTDITSSFKNRFNESGGFGAEGWKTGYAGKMASGLVGTSLLLGASMTDEGSMWDSVLSGAGTGAMLGMGFGGVVGLIGGAIGAGLGAFAHSQSNKNKSGAFNGGVVPKGFPNDTFSTKLTSGEAVIPLHKPEAVNKMKTVLGIDDDAVARKVHNMSVMNSVTNNGNNISTNMDWKQLAKALKEAPINLHINIKNDTDRRSKEIMETLIPKNSNYSFG